jgi:hypothetical protein
MSGSALDQVADYFDAIRCLHRPDTIRVLFVGESPPASGQFFYLGNSALFRATRKAFVLTFDLLLKSTGSFLSYFRQSGCYLEDLVPFPINQYLPSSHERLSIRIENVPRLAAIISECQPVAVICVMQDIEAVVKRAVDESGISLKAFFPLPFPRGEDNERLYISKLVVALRTLVVERILHDNLKTEPTEPR